MIETSSPSFAVLATVLVLAACSREPAPADAASPAPAPAPAPAALPVVEAPPGPVGEAPPGPVVEAAPTAPSETLMGTEVGEAVGTAAVDVAGTSPAPTGPTLVVVGERGAFEVGFDGTVVRTLVTTPGRSPRWLPKRRELAFLGIANGTSKDLRVLTVADGTERLVTSLPIGAPCLPEAYGHDGEDPPELDLRNEEELWVTPKGTYVCMVASDHGADLRSNDMTLAIRLSDGHVDDALTFGGEECGRETKDAPKACDDPPHVAYEEIESPFPGTGVASRSPNRRWLLVELRSALGDVLHRQLVLHDTKKGLTYPLPREGTGPWPTPMVVPPGDIEDEMIAGLPEVEGNEAIVWVGDQHVVIGRTLFVAGTRIVQLPGDVAY